MPSPQNNIGHEEVVGTDNRSSSTTTSVEEGVVAEELAAPDSYTPLSDSMNDNGTSNQYVMVSTGPEEDSDNDVDNCDGINARSGTFYVNPNAFGNPNGIDTSPTASAMQHFNYNDVATNALLQLDEEYRRTMEKPHSISADERQEDEDIKIIAAGFDERNNELKQKSEKSSLYAVAKGKHLQRQDKNEDNIDTDAIRKAVETISIKNKDAPFQQKFVVWQQNRLVQQIQRQKVHHKVIPTSTYEIFHAPSPTHESRLASANLTRSATLAEAVVRLSLLSFQGNLLLIDIVGVDHVECDSALTVRNAFRPFLKWVDDHLLSTQPHRKIHVHFRLIGRELSVKTTTNRVIVDLLDSLSTPIESLRATATYHSGVYHEFLEGLQEAGERSLDCVHCNNLEEKRSPDLVVAFNAGIWGYREWADTIQYLAQQKYPTTTILNTEAEDKNSAQFGIPFVVTAYTLTECQEDEEVISQSLTSDGHHGKILWESELNPFGSQEIRETKGSTEVYRDNAYWQAWLLGGKIQCSS